MLLSSQAMKKILIISYFFPPCNLTPSQRTISWARLLHKHGYYPIVITRRWDTKINSAKQISVATPHRVYFFLDHH